MPNLWMAFVYNLKVATTNPQRLSKIMKYGSTIKRNQYSGRGIPITSEDSYTPIPEHIPSSSSDFLIKHSYTQEICQVEEISSLQGALNAKNHPIECSKTYKLIDAWLLDIFTGSHLQQTQLQQLIPQGALSRTAWLQRIICHWDKSQADDAHFHSGDTTVPSIVSSQPIQ